MKDKDTIQSIRFNSNITDEQLRAFFGAENVVEITRGSWMSYAKVRSDEPEGVLAARLEKWFDEWRQAESERHMREGAERYAASVKKFHDSYKGLPVTRSLRDGRQIHGYTNLDDNGNWIDTFPSPSPRRGHEG